jgi:hypothetical protein
VEAVAVVAFVATAAALAVRESEGERAPRVPAPEGFLATLSDLPLGRPRVVPSYVNSPGYFRRDDPESLAEYAGRRDVAPISDQFFFAAPSAESIASAVVSAVRENSESRLRGLMIRFEEFETILWPEFPASRPASNVTAADAWGNLQGHAWGGMHDGLSEWGGADLRFHRLEAEGVKRYANFNLVEGVLIHAVDTDGREVVLDFAPSFVERDGLWKVYVYKE